VSKLLFKITFEILEIFKVVQFFGQILVTLKNSSECYMIIFDWYQTYDGKYTKCQNESFVRDHLYL